MPTLLRQRALLRLEYEHEKEAFRRATEVMSVGRKVKRGECWYPVTAGRSSYNALDRLVVPLTRSTDTDIEHAFEYGRPVCFFTMDGADNLQWLPFTATVSYAEADRMVVTVPDESAAARLQSAERLGVQLHFDETTYRLMFDAIDRTLAARDNRLAHLRDIVHGTLHPQFAAGSSMPPSLPWLNKAQEAAVADALRARDVMVVHGPPGTGKTTTLVETVCEVLRREPQVLVCAQSNTAVDWISSQLAARGLSVLRIGNPTRVTDDMLAHTYERRFESHPDYPALWQIRRTIRQMYALPRRQRPASFHQKMAQLRERADEMEIGIRHSLFDTTRVVAATLAGTANPVLTGHHFHTLFIDEAAQALEAACWIALQHADRVILAGDHCQLPPTVKCYEAQREGLAVTMMEVLARERPECVRLLSVQYRMSEALMRFSSEWFYDGRLTAAPEVQQRSMLEQIDNAMVWIDTDDPRHAGPAGGDDDAESGHDREPLREAYVAASYGRINKGEARLTIEALTAYVERLGRQRLIDEGTDFGIISPYKAQVQYLRHLVRRNEVLRPLARRITVNTVDAFQGQERDVILVSLVRANDEGQIGFLTDLRRMNVAITRARSKLILIGSGETLGHHRFYRELYKRCAVE